MCRVAIEGLSAITECVDIDPFYNVFSEGCGSVSSCGGMARFKDDVRVANLLVKQFFSS